MAARGQIPRLVLPAVFLLSAAVLGYEVLLLRLFTLMHGHHFASMVISLSLLGLGTGGVALRLAWTRLLDAWTWALPLLSLLFALSLPLSLFLAGAVRFNPLEMVWTIRQWLALWALYACFALPFFWAGLGIGLALSCGRFRINRIYAADLAGAAAGSGLTLLLLFLLPAARILLLLAGGALLAAACFGLGLLPVRRALALCLCLGCAGLALTQPGLQPRVQPSEYKGLSKTLLLPKTGIVAETTSPAGRLTLVRSPEVPFRFAPGLSHHCRSSPPDQLGLFIDGESAGVLNLLRPGRRTGAVTDCLPSAAAYRLLENPRILCNQAGQGLGILEGLEHQARPIVGVQSHPGLVRWLGQAPGKELAAVYARPEVALTSGSVRSLLARSDEPFDCIRLWTPGGRAGTLRGQPLQETFDFTVQAFAAYLEHLNEGGLLLLIHWLNPLWTETAKILATVSQACPKAGLSGAQCGTGLILSQSTAVCLVKKGGFSTRDRLDIRAFCREFGFEAVFFAKSQPPQKSRPDSQLSPETFKSLHSLALSNDSRGAQRFKFHVRPATDAAPYFNRFFSWSSLSEIWGLRSLGGASLVQWGYLILLATLVQALLAGGLLLLLPLIRRRSARKGLALNRTLSYFTCLGFGFLFVEIALMQRMTLFMGQPIPAVTGVLVAVLLGAGLGSARAERIGLLKSTAAVAGICLFYALALPGLLEQGMGWPLPWRVAAGMLISGLPAFFMGVPFPAGLARLQQEVPAWTPWAWAVNGFASVLSPLLAALICLHAGFSWLMAGAALLYLLAWFAQSRGFLRAT